MIGWPRREDNMKVLVSGASSQIGFFLLPRLRQLYCPLWLLSRAGGEQLPESGCAWLPVDLENAADRLRLVRRLADEGDVFILIHLAPLWLLPPLLRDMLAADIRLSRVVALSSTSRLTKINSPVAQERLVAERLARAEQTVVEICSQQKVFWTILRPTLVYGCRRDKNITFIENFVRRFGFFPVAGQAAGLRQPVHADDLAKAITTMIGHPETYNKIYTLAGGETLSYRQMVARVFRSCGRKERIISLPPWLFQALAAMSCFLFRRLSITSGMIRRMNEDLCFDYDDAVKDFGYQPRRFKC
ncbi:MAG: NAD-dependent dehydratase [Deltaproteobacteria bacterium]|nr:MAG: NAD-dependent dehydratase [Deltaproteobacteria bacterium]